MLIIERASQAVGLSVLLMSLTLTQRQNLEILLMLDLWRCYLSARTIAKRINHFSCMLNQFNKINCISEVCVRLLATVSFPRFQLWGLHSNAMPRQWHGIVHKFCTSILTCRSEKLVSFKIFHIFFLCYATKAAPQTGGWPLDWTAVLGN